MLQMCTPPKCISSKLYTTLEAPNVVARDLIVPHETGATTGVGAGVATTVATGVAAGTTS